MAVRRYDEKILNSLLDKYEGSLLYTGKNRRRQTISFAVTKTTLPEYFDEASLQYETIHAQLGELEQKGYIQLAWKNRKPGHILEKCILCPEKAEEIYALLHRLPKAEKEARLLAACEECKGKHPVIDHFLKWVEARLHAGESVRPYADPDTPEKIKERCDLLLEILTNQEEIFLREFSVRFWKDSKIAEKELGGAASIITRFSDDETLRGLDTEQLLEEFGIYKNPSWVMIKGSGRLWIDKDKTPDDIEWSGEAANRQKPFSNSGNLSLADFPGGIGLSSEDISRVRWDTMSLPPRVITIENLTSFHRWNETDTMAIYLGGYHNRVKRAFLRILYQTYQESKSEKVTFEHFGDIDCGGFRIWKNLCEKTGIPFQTRFMDEATYFKYLEYGKSLTPHDRQELERMAEEPYFAAQKGLFAAMLRCGKKLEQECIRL
ncbi:MAG: DUF2220 domain-containing protein [Lachnospiraceae bacterium]|nr:DUF2220 domain-containing protein [Lachnospiraceae bacterium]